MTNETCHYRTVPYVTEKLATEIWENMEKYFDELGLPPQISPMAVRASLPVMIGKVQIGYVSTSTWSPLLKKYIALAHLQRPYYEVGTNVQMEITVEHHRHINPFVDDLK